MTVPERSACRALVLMTKPARPGRVKTRLIGRLGAAGAARLHAAFLADVRASLAAGAFARYTAWALAPDEAVPAADGPWEPGFRQQGADLGERIWHALATVAARGHELVAAVGSDHPEITAATVEAAFERLARADLVVGPAADGGYVLIAVRAAVLERGLFEGIAWSTDAVCAQTLDRARALGRQVETLPIGHDVDDAAALDALAERLAAAPASRCLNTRAWLADHRVGPARSAVSSGSVPT